MVGDIAEVRAEGAIGGMGKLGDEGLAVVSVQHVAVGGDEPDAAGFLEQGRARVMQDGRGLGPLLGDVGLGLGLVAVLGVEFGDVPVAAVGADVDHADVGREGLPAFIGQADLGGGRRIGGRLGPDDGGAGTEDGANGQPGKKDTFGGRHHARSPFMGRGYLHQGTFGTIRIESANRTTEFTARSSHRNR